MSSGLVKYAQWRKCHEIIAMKIRPVARGPILGALGAGYLSYTTDHTLVKSQTYIKWLLAIVKSLVQSCPPIEHIFITCVPV